MRNPLARSNETFETAVRCERQSGVSFLTGADERWAIVEGLDAKVTGAHPACSYRRSRQMRALGG